MPDEKDTGTSMVELLVTMIITTLVVAATVVASVGLQRSAAQVIARQDQVDIGRTAGDRLSTTLVSAVDPTSLAIACPSCTPRAFVAADGQSMTFYTNLDNEQDANGALRVTYTVPSSGAKAGHLVETVQTATVAGSTFSFCNVASPSCAAATVTTRDLTPNAIISTSPPIFRYFASDGTEIAAGGAALSTSQLAGVMSVELRLAVQRDGATQVKATTFVQRITLPNQQADLQPR